MEDPGSASIQEGNSLSVFFSCSREFLKAHLILIRINHWKTRTIFMSQCNNRDLSHHFFSYYACPNVLLCQHYAHMLLAPIIRKTLPVIQPNSEFSPLIEPPLVVQGLSDSHCPNMIALLLEYNRYGPGIIGNYFRIIGTVLLTTSHFC